MSDTVTRNDDMLDLLYLWAKQEDAKKRAGKPSEWDQGSWVYLIPGDESSDDEVYVENSCGTACCIAGKAVAVAGGAYASYKDEGYTFLDGDNVWMPGASHAVPIDDAAAEVLGLNPVEANALFNGNNDLEALRRIIKEIRNGDYRR